MNRDGIIRIAREAGFVTDEADFIYPPKTPRRGIGLEIERVIVLAAAAEREKVAAWMRSKSYATGHGDTTEDLLKELEWQVAEREREACAKVCDEQADSPTLSSLEQYRAKFIADAIRAR